MKRFRIVLAVLTIAALVSPLAVSASNISNAAYRGTIVVSNNSTATSQVSTVMTLNTADMISSGYINSSLNNVVIKDNNGVDVPFMPSVNSTYPWVIFVDNITANSYPNYSLYTGGPDMSSTKYMMLSNAGMTVLDSPTLENTSNWSLSASVRVGQSANITRKTGALLLSDDGAGTITGNVTMAGSFTVEQLLGINTVSMSFGTRVVGQKLPSLLPGTISSTSFYILKTGAPTGTANVSVRKASDKTLIGTLGTLDISTVVGPISFFTFSNPVVNPTEQDIVLAFEGFDGGAGGDYISLGFDFTNDTTYGQSTSGTSPTSGGYSDFGYDLILKYTFTPTPSEISLAATSITSGEKNVVLTNSANLLSLYVDSVLKDSVYGASMADTADNWLFLEGVPYADSITYSVNSTLSGSWAYEYNPLGTFTDLSGNGNTATPSFRTASSDADVSAVLTSFVPISPAIAPPFTVSNPSAFYSTNTTMSGTFGTGNVSSSNLPGSDVVDAASDAAGLPNAWLWGILIGFTMVMGGLLLSLWVRHNGAGSGELFIRIAWGTFCLGMVVALGKMDWWVLLLYLFIAIAFGLASRQYDIGASISELNLIGFLSTSWVGLTTVNRILEGSFMNSTDAGQWNNLMFTQQFTIGNIFTLPIMNFSFFTEGIPNLVKWNYSFFNGNAMMIQYLLYSLTAILGFIIFGLIIGTLSRSFTR